MSCASYSAIGIPAVVTRRANCRLGLLPREKLRPADIVMAFSVQLASA